MLDGSDFSVKVEFAEGGKPEYLEKNPRSQIETNLSPLTEPRTRSQIVEVGGVSYDHYTNLTFRVMDCSFLEHFIRYSPHSSSGTCFAFPLSNDFSEKLTQKYKTKSLWHCPFKVPNLGIRKVYFMTHVSSRRSYGVVLLSFNSFFKRYNQDLRSDLPTCSAWEISVHTWQKSNPRQFTCQAKHSSVDRSDNTFYDSNLIPYATSYCVIIYRNAWHCSLFYMT